MSKHDNDENQCIDTKKILDSCAGDAFSKVNTDPKWVF